MSRESVYTGYLNHGNALTIPLYNVAAAGLFIERIDGNDATGNIVVRNIMPKSYTYDTHVLFCDGPLAMYGFPLNQQAARVPMAPYALNLSTLAAPLEVISGRAVSLSGGNLVAGNYTVARLAGQQAMVPPAVQAQDTFTGISAQDAAGFGWTVEAWVFRNSATLSNLYAEINAGVTSYLLIQIDAGGHIVINQSGTVRYTGVQVIGTGAWHHVVIVYTGTQIITYVDGVAAAAVAYTHAASYTSIVNNQINRGASNIHYTQSLACYSKALTADDVARHYREITDAGGSAGDFQPGVAFATPLNYGLYGGAYLLFSNNITPWSYATSGAGQTTSIVLPLLGVAQIVVSSNVTTDRWFYVLRIVEVEGVQ